MLLAFSFLHPRMHCIPALSHTDLTELQLQLLCHFTTKFLQMCLMFTRSLCNTSMQHRAHQCKVMKNCSCAWLTLKLPYTFQLMMLLQGADRQPCQSVLQGPSCFIVGIYCVSMSYVCILHQLSHNCKVWMCQCHTCAFCTSQVTIAKVGILQNL